MYNLEKIWPEWKAVRVIGEGSSGKVYEIVRNKMGIEEHSALKVISVPHSQSETNVLLSEGMDEKSTADYYQSIVNAFVQEISLMSKLKGYPNIVTYEDYQVVKHDNDIGWDILIRMELLTPFSEITRTNRFDVANTVDFALQICEALSVCHKNSILHRDIKYDNIFVSRMGTYKLGDFGVARKFEKTSGNFSLKGTYTYMAPEIYKGQAYGVASDIYSFGIVLYRLLNKNREAFVPLPPQPIKLSDKENALIKRMGGKNLPAPVDADSELSRIVLKACAFYTSDRYKSIDELKDDLYNYKTNKSNLKEDVIVSDSDDDKTVSVFSAYDEAKVVYMSEDDKTSAVFDGASKGFIYGTQDKSVGESDRLIQVSCDDTDKTVATLDYSSDNSEKENKINTKSSVPENTEDKNSGKEITDKKPKKKKWKIVLIIVLVILLLNVLGNDIRLIVENNSEPEITSGDYYTAGKKLLESYAESQDDATIKEAVDCFEKAGNYKNADFYLEISECCLAGDEFAAAEMMKEYIDDKYIYDILKSPKYLDNFLAGKYWKNMDYYFSVSTDGYTVITNITVNSLNAGGTYESGSYCINAEEYLYVEILDFYKIKVTNTFTAGFPGNEQILTVDGL